MDKQTNVLVDREMISALVDGQVRGAQLSSVLGEMQDDRSRECWLTYHLIGDVLRSSDLAQSVHGLEFAQRVCVQIKQTDHLETSAATEFLVAERPPAANDGVFRWKMVAGLASFAAIAAVGWSVMGSYTGGSAQGSRLALMPAVANSQQVVAVDKDAVPVTTASQKLMGDASVMLRDPRLDKLLAAHRAAAGASALGSTAGFLRNATFERPGS